MIGKIIKTMRRKCNISQKELAKKCNISNTTLSGYENNYREPTFKMIEQIANECGYKISFTNSDLNDILTSDNIDRKEI